MAEGSKNCRKKSVLLRPAAAVLLCVLLLVMMGLPGCGTLSADSAGNQTGKGAKTADAAAGTSGTFDGEAADAAAENVGEAGNAAAEDAGTVSSEADNAAAENVSEEDNTAAEDAGTVRGGTDNTAANHGGAVSGEMENLSAENVDTIRDDDNNPAAENSSTGDGEAENASAENIRADSSENESDQAAFAIVSSMSLEDKIAQMFILLPEQLTGMDQVVQAGDATRGAIGSFPVGGLIYMEGNIIDRDQVREMLSNTQAFSLERTGLPLFTLVDEEGGSVTRISGYLPDVPIIPSMWELGERGSTEEAYETGQTIGSYLAELGFNCDCAPVADVLSNPENEVIGNRSFSSDPDLAAAMSVSLAEGLKSGGVFPIFKHFPGHGGTAGDTHSGFAALYKTKEELLQCELVPFRTAIEAGAEMIMAAHISLPEICGDSTPASINPVILTGILREELGYSGIIMTDALNMGAIADNYTSAEAALMAVNAGADILLMPADPYSAYYALVDAVYAGEISEDRIDESVRRIVKLKLSLNS